jgi:hypothetical protein
VKKVLDKERWSLRDAFAYVTVCLAAESSHSIEEVRERAKTQILDHLIHGELKATAQRFYRTSEVEGALEQRDILVQSDFWEWAEIAWASAEDYAHRRPWFRFGFKPAPGTLDPLLSYQAFGITFASADVRSLWSFGPPDNLPAPIGSAPRLRGRPRGRSLESADERVLQQMERLLGAHEAGSPTEAAWSVIGRDGKGARGAGEPESKVRRLVRRYAQKHSSRGA